MEATLSNRRRGPGVRWRPPRLCRPGHGVRVAPDTDRPECAAPRAELQPGRRPVLHV